MEDGVAVVLRQNSLISGMISGRKHLYIGHYVEANGGKGFIGN